MRKIKNFYSAIDKRLRFAARKKIADRYVKKRIKLLQLGNIPVKKLTDEQKREVDRVWNGKIRSKDYSTYEFLQAITGKFDPYICSESLYLTDISFMLNDQQMMHAFTDKNYLNMFFPEVPTPKTILRNVNGVYLDKDYKIVERQRALEFLSEYDSVIVKPTLESGSGINVKKFEKSDFKNIDKEYKSNFIIQEVFRQHYSLSELNPSSVNVVRVVTLNLNDKVSVVNCTLRCGAEGSLTDNYITDDGKGMFVIGVTPEGTLKDEAFFSGGVKIDKANNGKEFKGLQLPNFDKVIEMTCAIHEKIPYFAFLGFDICFAEDGEPHVMEINVRAPGVYYYQVVNGPIFGDRTQEVIDKFLK